MQPLEIILGCLVILAAFIVVVVAFDEMLGVALGAAVLLASGGGWLVYHGVHGEHAKFHAKHEAILRDLRRQGFHLRSDQVFAVGGHYLTGTEADIATGGCLVPLIAARVDGTWRVALPGSELRSRGLTLVTPADLGKMAAGCR